MGAEGGWEICYQSRATPQHWIGPSTEQEIERAAHDRVAVLVVPIAFVSDHSETLVELDVDYRGLADRLGVAGTFVPRQRIPTLLSSRRSRTWFGCPRARPGTVQPCRRADLSGGSKFCVRP